MRDISGRFVKGNIPWSHYKGHSQETKDKLRILNLGKKLPPETREKLQRNANLRRKLISLTPEEILIKSGECPICHKKSTFNGISHHIKWMHSPHSCPNKGKIRTIEANEKNRIKHLGKPAWNKGLKGFRKGIPNTKEQNEKIRAKRLLRKMPFRDTLPERLLQEGLTKLGIKFTTHKAIMKFCQTDIFIEPNICIFADGDYWHTAIEKVCNQDKKVNALLPQGGYRVIRFWEHEIKQDTNACLIKILEEV